MTFETDESVLFIEVSLIQRCPDRERFHCIYIYCSIYTKSLSINHCFFNPSNSVIGPLPLGYRYEAQQRSDATHEIPLSGFDQAVSDYRQLLWEIESFISPEGGRDIPAVFSKVRT